MTTFRAVVKPRKKIVSTDVSGTLDFEDKYNSIDFTSGQSSNISTLSNVLHWIDGQTIMMHNSQSSDVVIAGSLMEDGLAVDIEQDTTTLLFWIASAGKFKDQGGTARIKDVEVDFAAHDHDGTDSPEVIATNLDSATSTNSEFLKSDGAGNAEWAQVPGYKNGRFRCENTDTTTNLNTSTSWATPATVPLVGTATRNDSDFTVIGQTIRCNFAGRVRAIANCEIYSTASRMSMLLRFLKNGTAFGFVGGGMYIRSSSAIRPNVAFLEDEFDVALNDTISVGTIRGTSVSGSATLNAAGTSGIILERVE